jgi:fumarate reductase flavoprotein subunit
MGRELPGYLSSTSYFELAFLHYSTPGIMVNATGKNVGNIISGNHAKMASVALDKSHGGKFYYVFDENSVPSTKNFLTYGFNTYDSMFNRGEVLPYKSVAEAAKDLALPDLQAAIDANNAASLANKADEFGRTNCPFIDTRNGIYIIKVIPTFYLTSAGLCIDLNGHVLTDSYVADGQNNAITGLYACGDVCGSAEEKDGKPYGMGFDIAMGYGYTVAKAVESDKVSKSGKAS